MNVSPPPMLRINFSVERLLQKRFHFLFIMVWIKKPTSKSRSKSSGSRLNFAEPAPHLVSELQLTEKCQFLIHPMDVQLNTLFICFDLTYASNCLCPKLCKNCIQNSFKSHCLFLITPLTFVTDQNCESFHTRIFRLCTRFDNRDSVLSPQFLWTQRLVKFQNPHLIAHIKISVYGIKLGR